MRFSSTVTIIAVLGVPSVSAFVTPLPSRAQLVPPRRNVLFALTREEVLEREINQALEEREARRLQLQADVEKFKQEFQQATKSLENVDAQLSQEAQSYQAQRDALKQKLQQETASFQSRFEREKKSLESVDSNIVKKLERLERIKAAGGGASSTAASSLLEGGVPLAPFAVISAAAAGLAVRRRQQQIQEEKLEQERRRSRAVSEASETGNAVTTLAAGIVGVGVLVATFTTISNTASIPFGQQKDSVVVSADQPSISKKQSEPMPPALAVKAPAQVDGPIAKEVKRQQDEKLAKTPPANTEEAPTAAVVAKEEKVPVAKLDETVAQQTEQSKSIEPVQPTKAVSEKIETNQQVQTEPATTVMSETPTEIVDDKNKPLADDNSVASSSVALENDQKVQREATIKTDDKSSPPQVVAVKPTKLEHPESVEKQSEIAAETKDTPENTVVQAVPDQTKVLNVPRDMTSFSAKDSSTEATDTATSALENVDLPDLPDFNKALEGVQLPDTSGIQTALSEALEDLPNNTPALVTIGATLTAALVTGMLNLFKGDLEEASSESKESVRPREVGKSLERKTTIARPSSPTSTTANDRGTNTMPEIPKGPPSAREYAPSDALGERRRKPSSVDTENVARAFAKLANMQESRPSVSKNESPKSPPPPPKSVNGGDTASVSSSIPSGSFDKSGTKRPKSSGNEQSPERASTPPDYSSRQARSEKPVGAKSNRTPNHSGPSTMKPPVSPREPLRSKSSLPKAPKVGGRPTTSPKVPRTPMTGTTLPLRTTKDSGKQSLRKDTTGWKPPTSSERVSTATTGAVPSSPTSETKDSTTQSPRKDSTTPWRPSAASKPVPANATGKLTASNKPAGKVPSRETNDSATQSPTKNGTATWEPPTASDSVTSEATETPTIAQNSAGSVVSGTTNSGSSAKESQSAKKFKPAAPPKATIKAAVTRDAAGAGTKESSSPKKADSPFERPVVSSGSGTLTPLEKRYASKEASDDKQPMKPEAVKPKSQSVSSKQRTRTPLEKRYAAKLASGKNRFNKSSKKTNRPVAKDTASATTPQGDKVVASKDDSNDTTPKKVDKAPSSAPKAKHKTAANEGPTRSVRTLTPLERKYASKTTEGSSTSKPRVDAADRKDVGVQKTKTQQTTESDTTRATSSPVRKPPHSHDPSARRSRKSRPIITVEPVSKTFTQSEKGTTGIPAGPKSNDGPASKSPGMDGDDGTTDTEKSVPDVGQEMSDITKDSSSPTGKPPPGGPSGKNTRTITGSILPEKKPGTLPWKSTVPKKKSSDTDEGGTAGSKPFETTPDTPSWKSNLPKTLSSEKDSSTPGSNPFGTINPNSLSDRPPPPSEKSVEAAAPGAGKGSTPNPFGTFSLDSLSGSSNGGSSSKPAKKGTSGPPTWMTGGFSLDALSRSTSNEDEPPSETIEKKPTGSNPFGMFNLDALSSNKVTGESSASDGSEDQKFGPVNGDDSDIGGEEEPFS